MRTHWLALVLISMAMWKPLSTMAASATFSRESVGTIVKTNGDIAGTGFVAGNPPAIITCFHVVQACPEGSSFVDLSGTSHAINQANSLLLPYHDLAVLNSTSSLPSKLEIGDFSRIRPGDDLLYLGFNVTNKALKAHYATVSSVGQTIDQGRVIDFLEFNGEGIPGYSGGPVFDKDGKVVAIMREAWTKQGLKGGDSVLVNRAYSVSPLTLLNRDLFRAAPVGSTNSKPVGISLPAN